MAELQTSTAHSEASPGGRAIDAVIVQIPYEMCGELIAELGSIIHAGAPLTTRLFNAVNDKYVEVMTDEAIERFTPPSDTAPTEDVHIQRGFVLGYLKAKGALTNA